jgi:SAM-dependent methyltransferase
MEVAGSAPVLIRKPLMKAARSAAEIEQHYLVEIELAEKLRAAPRDQRLGLYGQVYDELFRRVPAHPQLTRKVSDAERAAAVAIRMAGLRPFIEPDTVFLEVGAGDGSFTLAVAELASRCYALDVSREILDGVRHPKVQTVLSDGCSVPVPPNSVTLAYSNQVMEHIHPDDALEQLRNLYAAIAPGGSYICVTPNRLNGPHDVSKFFDPVARGFHLKEYTIGELEQLFRGVGFSRVLAYPRVFRRNVRVPMGLLRGVERLLASLPDKLRRRLGQTSAVKNLLSPLVRGIK